MRSERDSAERSAAQMRAQHNAMQETLARARGDLQQRIDQLEAEAKVWGMFGRRTGYGHCPPAVTCNRTSTSWGQRPRCGACSEGVAGVEGARVEKRQVAGGTLATASAQAGSIVPAAYARGKVVRYCVWREFRWEARSVQGWLLLPGGCHHTADPTTSHRLATLSQHLRIHPATLCKQSQPPTPSPLFVPRFACCRPH
eukprot:291778-Chlamydomonas_euryale.AAC.2